MLNRLFVIVGFLVILAIGAAFVVPRLIQWGDYRGRLETMAAQAFGTEVAITGDIALTLLPQPELVLTKVRVGPEAAPAMQVERVEAAFSLFDFLSDRYKVTRLQIENPVVSLAIAADGTLASGLTLGEQAGQSNVSIDNADVVGGTVRLADARSGDTYTAEGIDGLLRLEAIRGPFSFQGTASLDGAGYAVRIATGRLGEDGATTLSLAIKAADDSFALESNGALETGALPKYVGELSYRRPPPRPKEGEAIDVGRGDLVLEGKVEAVADRVLLTEYTLLPDENRGATRLLGAAEVKLGKDVSFNAIISGGVIALPPRDATTELTDPPYELVRLLGETPLPPIPAIPGTIGLDITEFNLRGTSLRDLRLDAATDAKSWTIEKFAASLPGGTSVGLTGNLSIVDGHPIFAGGVSLDSRQLDRLAALWRKPPPGNPLFNMPGSLTADVALSRDTLTLSAGTLVVAGINQGFDAAIGFGQTRELKLDAHFTTLGETESAAVAALMPDLATGGSFGATFPKGNVTLSASKAVLFGLQGSELAVNANWEGGVLELSKLHAADLGGAAIDAKFTAFGSLAKPELSGSGTIKVADGAPVVTALLGNVATPPAIVDFLRRSLPADVAFQLDAPLGDGGQTLSATGQLATASATLTARLGAGIVNALSAPLTAQIELTSESPGLMTAQLGLGDLPVFDDRTPLHLVASVDGVPSNSYELHARVEGGADHIAFDGNVVPGDFTRISGDGAVSASLSDPSALVELLGAGGVYVPAIEGSAHLQFAGLDSLKLTSIDAAGVSGDLTLTRREGIGVVGGALTIPALDMRQLLPVLAGASGTISGEGVWPEGPIDIGVAPRRGEGRVDVAIASVTADGRQVLSDATLGVDWNAQEISLRDLTGNAGDGTLTLDASICCSNAALPAKQITGRLALNGVPLDLVVPGALAAGLDGTVDASAAFDGTGDSISMAMASMTGTGSYTLRDFSAAQFDPATFNAIGTLSGIVDMAPEALVAAITERLAAGPFASNMFTGSFTVAGGTLRSPNLAIAGTGARIFGGATLSLRDLTVDARYAMSPTVLADPTSAVDPTTAEVVAIVKGPIWAPVASYDVAALADGMKIKASEIELVRLEQLRVEDEKRRDAALVDRARVAAEQAAVEEKRKAAAAEAARIAEEERLAAEQEREAASRQPPQPIDLGL